MSATVYVCVQSQDFNCGDEISALQSPAANIGALSTFIGYVRANPKLDPAVAEQKQLSSLTLEHYPGMTEKTLSEIAIKAEERWPLLGIRIIHRFGKLFPGEQIVFVGVAAAHRHAAFEACTYIMDFLKTSAPFWKKETTPDGSFWVEARKSDENSCKRW